MLHWNLLRQISLAADNAASPQNWADELTTPAGMGLEFHGAWPSVEKA